MALGSWTELTGGQVRAMAAVTGNLLCLLHRGTSTSGNNSQNTTVYIWDAATNTPVTQIGLGTQNTFVRNRAAVGIGNELFVATHPTSNVLTIWKCEPGAVTPVRTLVYQMGAGSASDASTGFMQVAMCAVDHMLYVFSCTTTGASDVLEYNTVSGVGTLTPIPAGAWRTATVNEAKTMILVAGDGNQILPVAL